MSGTLALLVICSLLFFWLTAAFDSFSSLTGGRILKVAEQDRKFAEQLELWYDRYDSICAVMKVMLRVLAACVGVLAMEWASELTTGVTHRYGWLIVMLVVILLTIASELLARFMLLRLDLSILKWTIPVISGKLFYPLVFLFNKTSMVCEGRQRADATVNCASIEDEIMSFVDGPDEDEPDGLGAEEKQMIRGVLELEEMSVREIMTPRVDLIALPSTAGIEEATRSFLHSGHSRIPLYGENLDDIKGVLYAKDFIDKEHLKGKTLTQLARPAIFIPETKEVSDLLRQIKSTNNHIAVVIDEYGGTSGVITLEDIIEEIVGEVHDEYDTADDFEEPPLRQEDGSFVLSSRTLISDVNSLAGAELEDDEEADTIGGYICARMGRIPMVGDRYEENGVIRAEILEADSRTIKKIKLEVICDRAKKTTTES